MGPPENLLPPEALTLVGRFPRRLIVGVASDVKGGSLNQPTPSLVYAPLTQHRREGWSNNLMLAVQTSTTPEALTSAIREQVRARSRSTRYQCQNDGPAAKPDAFRGEV